MSGRVRACMRVCPSCLCALKGVIYFVNVLYMFDCSMLNRVNHVVSLSLALCGYPYGNLI